MPSDRFLRKTTLCKSFGEWPHFFKQLLSVIQIWFDSHPALRPFLEIGAYVNQFAHCLLGISANSVRNQRRRYGVRWIYLLCGATASLSNFFICPNIVIGSSIFRGSATLLNNSRLHFHDS